MVKNELDVDFTPKKIVPSAIRKRYNGHMFIILKYRRDKKDIQRGY